MTSAEIGGSETPGAKGPQPLAFKGFVRPSSRLERCPTSMWVWLKIHQEGLRRFWSMFPLTRVPFWFRFFEPQPCVSWDSAKFVGEPVGRKRKTRPFSGKKSLEIHGFVGVREFHLETVS